MTIAEGYAALLAAWLMAAEELDGTLTLVCLPQGPCRLTSNFIRFTATSGPFTDRPECGAQQSLAAIIGATGQPNFHPNLYRGKPCRTA